MADQREVHLQEQAAKKRRDKVKKGFTTFVLIVLAILMVISLAPGIFDGGGRGARGGIEIATVKGAKYSYINGSSFYYLTKTIQDGISRQYGKQIDPDALRKYSVLQSASSLRSMALSHQLAKKVGLKPSKDWMRFGAQRISQNIKLENVNQGMREFLEMEYAMSALSPQGGDLLSVVAPVTIGELYSYFDLVNYTVKAEFVYLNISNYIKSRIQEKDLQEYYAVNPTYYAESARVESIAVQSKELSLKIQNEVLKNGWETALKKYLDLKDDRISFVAEQKIDAEKPTANRFKSVLSDSSNNIVLTPVLEEKAYHIVHILGYNSYSSLSTTAKAAIRSDYMSLNYDRLRTAYQEDIQKEISRLEKSVNSTKSLSSSVRGSAFSYFKSFNISPVNQLVRDENNAEVSLPLMANKSWMDFLFTAEPGSISKTYYDEAYVVKMKVNTRGYNSDIEYDKIDQQVYQRYMYFKTGAVTKDWVDQLQSDYNFVLDEDNLKKIY